MMLPRLRHPAIRPSPPVEEPTLEQPTIESTTAADSGTSPTQAPVPTSEQPTPDTGDQVTPTLTIAPDITSTATISGTPSVTPAAGTPTATPEQSDVTPEPTTSKDSPQQRLHPVRLWIRVISLTQRNIFQPTRWAPEKIHSWSMEVFEDEVINVGVIAPVPADIVLSLYEDGQPIIDHQNQSPAASAEMLTAGNQTDTTYELRIQTENGQAAEYIVVISFEGDIESELLGFLAPGTPAAMLPCPSMAAITETSLPLPGSDQDHPDARRNI
ncbi:MAG: hypothetical protein R3C44_12665 [Chloroflexota bacterium]